jgi:uridine kinase
VVARISRGRAPGWVRDALAGRSGTRWVGVDGLGAAGKTTLATEIAAVLPGAVVVAVDDFGRVGVRGWDSDLFVRQVVQPLRSGRPARYQTWDLRTDSPLGWAEVQPGRPVVVEGVSATDRRVPVPWDLTLWVDAPAALRWSRIVSRDGPDLLDRWRDDWLPSEQDYVATQQPQARVDAVVTYDGPSGSGARSTPATG